MNLPGEGSKQNPYQISCESELFKIGENKTSEEVYYEIVNDIRCERWHPENIIVREGHIIDGNGHSIINFQSKNKDFSGLFMNAGVIKNLKIKESVIKGLQAGSICGKNTGKLINCSAIDCKISIPSKGNMTTMAGGLVGFNSGEIISCKCDEIEINDSANMVGGLAGYNASNNSIIKRSKVEDSFLNGGSVSGGVVGRNEGKVVHSSSSSTYLKIGKTGGGIAGENHGVIEDSNSDVLIMNNDSIDMIIGGGLSGRNIGIIRNSYFTGLLNLEENGDFSFGLITGGNQDKVYNCYTTCEESRELIEKTNGMNSRISTLDSEEKIKENIIIGKI